MALVIPNLERLSFDYSDDNPAFVEMLSLYDCPNCSPRGTGTDYGMLAQVQISATGDDGSWQYNGTFYTNTVTFGDITPVI